MHKSFLAFIAALLLTISVLAQSPNATINGLVLDSSGAVIVGAEVIVVNDAAGFRYATKTNEEGIYLLPGLAPGSYRIQVSNTGFKTIIKPNVEVHVQDALAINFNLPIGSSAEIVTVQAVTPLVNTENASVSTVIDRNFVERLPLNGRSFNTLLQLTPGVVIPPAHARGSGQFSIAGQRTDANNFTVDGVSANFGVGASPQPGESGGGSSQAFSALGSTSSMVSVEALQEFRIETSSFAPEFGGSSGGQVILTTRSGTNTFHGALYEYFRNDIFDANDWFANASGKARPAERHNDFGGFLGGPILRDKTFFFLSYEGARLRVPSARQTPVPSAWARAVATSASLAPFLNVMPEPDDKAVTPGVYTSPFTGVWSDSATLDAGSARFDHYFGEHFSFFGRYNQAPSELVNRVFSLSTLNHNSVDTRTITVGLNAVVNSRSSNQLRFNYSTLSNRTAFSLDSFGGAVPLDPKLLLGPLPVGENLASVSYSGTSPYDIGRSGFNRTKQFDLEDGFSLSLGGHQTKYGIGYRNIDLLSRPSGGAFSYSASTVQNFLTSNGRATVTATTRSPASVRFKALSLYAQDTWKAARRLTVTYGLRWELAPAPEALGSTTLASWSNVADPALLTLAPPRTPLWGTTYSNFAPRLGIAYALTPDADFVLRLGGGVFYDLGVGSSVVGFFPNSAAARFSGQQLPVADPTPLLPALSLQPPYPNAATYGFSPELKLPRSYQWNLAIEKSFRSQHVVSATYLGQAGRKLLRQAALFQPNANFAGDFLLTTNEALSNYHALQIQYRRPLAARLQAILNYTWSHSLDSASNDGVAGLSNALILATNDYGPSDFDVRHSFSGAVTYDLPSLSKSGPLAFASRNWSLDAVVVARSGFPFNAINLIDNPDPGGNVLPRPDRLPAQPVWLSSATAPGGKSLNPNAFVSPTPIRQGTEGRNDISGFGFTQVDLSVARAFFLSDRISLQLRTDAFNALNHPNFANPLGFLIPGSTGFLQSNQMLNANLSGLLTIFQQGGPRSLQVSLKLSF